MSKAEIKLRVGTLFKQLKLRPGTLSFWARTLLDPTRTLFKKAGSP